MGDLNDNRKLFFSCAKIPQIDSSSEQYEAILLTNYVSTELQLKRLISN